MSEVQKFLDTYQGKYRDWPSEARINTLFSDLAWAVRDDLLNKADINSDREETIPETPAKPATPKDNRGGRE